MTASGGPNVLATRVALHRLTPEAVAAAGEAWRDRLRDLNVAVLLGGRSRSHRFTPETVEALADGLAGLEGPVAVTASPADGAGCYRRPEGAFAGRLVLGRDWLQPLSRHAGRWRGISWSRKTRFP